MPGKNVSHCCSHVCKIFSVDQSNCNNRRVFVFELQNSFKKDEAQSGPVLSCWFLKTLSISVSLINKSTSQRKDSHEEHETS